VAVSRPPGNFDTTPDMSMTCTETIGGESPRKRKLPAPFFVGAILILLVATFLRLHLIVTVPYGWHLDEASKAIIAKEVLQGQCCPAFFGQFTGREALYIYLEAGMMAIVRDPILAGRLVSVFLGLLTLSAVAALGRALYRPSTGLLASALMTVSLWHLIASRNGYRAVSQPLFEALVLLALVRGWQTHSRLQFVLSGFWLGLTLYTYTAARFFPVVIALGLLWMVWEARGPRFTRQLVLQHGGLLISAAAITAAPLALYFLQHPADLLLRASQISVFNPNWNHGDLAGLLWANFIITAGMFYKFGDPNYRFNLGGAPIFDPFTAMLLAAGLALSVGALFGKDARRRFVSFIGLSCFGVMLLPMGLSAENLPYYQRAIGILPVLYLFPAAAVEWLIQKLRLSPAPDATPSDMEIHLNSRQEGGAGDDVRRWLTPTLVGLWLIFLGGKTGRDYFQLWATSPRNYDDRSAVLVQAAEYLTQHPTTGARYISTHYDVNPTLALLSSQDYAHSHRFDASTAFVFPPAGQPADYLFLADAPLANDFVRLLPARLAVEYISDPFGRTAFEVLQWPANVLPPQPSRRGPVWASYETSFEPQTRQGQDLLPPVNLDGIADFLGYDRRVDEVTAGETVTTFIYWRVKQAPPYLYSSFVHILDSNAQLIANDDQLGYSSAYWQPGELIVSKYTTVIPPGTGPGEYQMEMGLYVRETGDRLSVVNPAGERVANRVLLSPLVVR